jgi:peptidoglycan/LPS O-acetylase OafA/YrhL
MYWVITVGSSFLLYRYFERPMTALREKWHPRGKRVVTAFPAPNTQEGGRKRVIGTDAALVQPTNGQT